MILMSLFARKEGRCSHREQTVDMVIEGKSGINQKSRINYIYTTMCKIESL